MITINLTEKERREITITMFYESLRFKFLKGEQLDKENIFRFICEFPDEMERLGNILTDMTILSVAVAISQEAEIDVAMIDEIIKTNPDRKEEIDRILKGTKYERN